jgi:transcriptional regulator with XRE-family HTH domain
MERLKQYLDKQRISQTELARRVGVSQPTVWGWLAGESLPSADTLKRLAVATGLSVDDLLDQPSHRFTAN